jgi:hypothetical protein
LRKSGAPCELCFLFFFWSRGGETAPSRKHRFWWSLITFAGSLVSLVIYFYFLSQTIVTKGSDKIFVQVGLFISQTSQFYLVGVVASVGEIISYSNKHCRGALRIKMRHQLVFHK